MITPIDLSIVNEFFLKDPKLCLSGLHDSDLVSLQNKGSVQDRPKSIWLGTLHNDELLSIIRIEPFDKMTVIVHLYMRSDYQKKNLLKYMYIDLVNYLLENTDYIQILVPVPKPCRHVTKAITPLGFKLQGSFPKSLTWRNKKVDLLYYTADLKENLNAS